MLGFIRNAPNPLLAERDFQVTSEYSRPQWALLAVVWVVLFLICVPLAALWMLAEWAFRLSGILTFMVCHRLFVGPVGSSDPAFRRQWARAYISNTIGTRLPHWNAPFRRFLFRLTGITLGRGGFIGMSGYMEDYHPENVVIEDNVTVSFGVTFVAHGAKRGKTNAEKHIILREGCYVGAASVILPSVEIGRRAVVGAGAVVTRDVPPGAIVAGSPARILRWQDGFGPEPDAKQEGE